jgi:hypothetical protein
MGRGLVMGKTSKTSFFGYKVPKSRFIHVKSKGMDYLRWYNGDLDTCVVFDKPIHTHSVRKLLSEAGYKEVIPKGDLEV